jgi:hypothetical protein
LAIARFLQHSEEHIAFAPDLASALATARALLAVTVPPTRAQTPKSTESLTVEEVVNLSKAGFSDDVIITRIRKNAKAFDLNSAEIISI